MDEGSNIKNYQNKYVFGAVLTEENFYTLFLVVQPAYKELENKLVY